MRLHRAGSLLRRGRAKEPSPLQMAPPPLMASTKLSYKMDDIVRLNVGGQRFDTRLRTLLADRSNDLFAHFVVLLESDLTESRLPPRDSEGSFFLDRDPEHFRSLLNNLRFYVHLQANQKLANGTNGAVDDEEDIKSTKSVGFLGRLLKK